MRTKSVFSKCIMTAAATTFILTIGFSVASAGFPAPPGVPGVLIPPGLPGSSVNVHVNGYVPAPPGVNVQIDSGRPYYVERDRRVYMERERPAKHYKQKKYKKEKRHHEDNGRRHGHDNDHDRGHGRGR